MKKEKVVEVFEMLEKMYTKVEPFLTHHNAFSFLVGVILSAQCTDERVNKVTPNLFGSGVGGFEHGYDSPEKMLSLGENGLKEIIKSCGFFNAKARNIIGMCYGLIENYGSEVPSALEEMIKLPGVGRKTASVLLTQWFNTPAVPVDTHVHRIANRLGLVNTKTADKTEMAFRKNVPEKCWIDGHLRIIVHGRTVCFARKPKCSDCALKDLCEWKEKVRYM